MSVVAAVITGASKKFAPQIEAHASALLREGDHYAYIYYPGAEAALAQENSLMDPSQQFAIRDILESKALVARNLGARLCVIVGAIACDPDSVNYEICAQIVRRERDMVAKWNLFSEIMPACLTPHCGVIPLL